MSLYTESVITRRSLPGAKVLLIMLLVFTAVFFLMANLLHLLYFVPMVIFGIAAFLFWRNTGIEFEYLQSDTSFAIDKIIHASRRKRLLDIHLNQVVLISVPDSPMLYRFRQLRLVDYTDRIGEENLYVMVCNCRQEKKKLLLQLEPKMLEALKKQIPGKFV